MRVSELTGAALDWAVAKCEGEEVSLVKGQLETRWTDNGWKPSTDWAQGGPIIERGGINVRWCVREKDGSLSRWWAEISKVIVDPLTKKKRGEKIIELGPTPLIAAMRCYVASKLGDEVEVPEELK